MKFFVLAAAVLVAANTVRADLITAWNFEQTLAAATNGGHRMGR